MATKPETILKLIRRKAGSSVTELEKATGWQPHSIRAALTGLRNKGHDIQRGQGAKGQTVYRLLKEA
jgi:DNA-binding IclR family transcriptional regulator